MATPACTHLDSVLVTELPGPPLECGDCVAVGSWWVHLRMCLTCGKVACCDNSPNKHATRHFRESTHPLIRSAEPGEGWSWCYVDEVGLVIRPES